MTNLFVGLDLDYTAFDTHHFFYDDVLPLLAQHYPERVVPAEFAADMAKFRVAHGPAVSYNLFDHTEALGLDSNAVESLIRQELGGRDEYLLPGVADFIKLQLQKQHDLMLITIGGERFQKLKVACAPILAELELHVIMEPKGAYIAKNFSDRQGYVIDDVPLHDLPSTILPLYVRTGRNQDLNEPVYDTVSDLLKDGPTDLLN